MLIYSIIDKIQKTIVNFDSYQFEYPNKFFYSKNYPLSSNRGRAIRIVIEVKEGRLEIVSIHLRKT
ncbi:MAG: hypothetical protein JWL92_335 [Candidatus Nomurabacteria bacterium]|nr:hypothetical protein [Candidatus Nomurabacteria bacterium]